jgi:hypothetical protein
VLLDVEANHLTCSALTQGSTIQGRGSAAAAATLHHFDRQSIECPALVGREATGNGTLRFPPCLEESSTGDWHGPMNVGRRADLGLMLDRLTGKPRSLKLNEDRRSGLWLTALGVGQQYRLFRRSQVGPTARWRMLLGDSLSGAS